MRLAENCRGNHKMKIILVFVFAISLFVVGCFHGERITRLQPGMSIEEVKSMMGPQEGYKKIGEYEIYSYYNKLLEDGLGIDLIIII